MISLQARVRPGGVLVGSGNAWDVTQTHRCQARSSRCSAAHENVRTAFQPYGNQGSVGVPGENHHQCQPAEPLVGLITMGLGTQGCRDTFAYIYIHV